MCVRVCACLRVESVSSIYNNRLRQCVRALINISADVSGVWVFRGLGVVRGWFDQRTYSRARSNCEGKSNNVINSSHICFMGTLGCLCPPMRRKVHASRRPDKMPAAF